MDNNTVADHAHLGVPLDVSVHDVASRDSPDLGYNEGFADLGTAEDLFGKDGGQQPGKSVTDILHNVVNDVVEPYVNLFLAHSLQRFVVGPHVKADDNGVGSGSQHDIAFVDPASALVDHFDPHLIGCLFHEGVTDGPHRTLDVCFQNNAQVLDLAVLDLVEQILQRYFLVACLHGLDLGLTQLGDPLGFKFISENDKRLTGVGHTAQSKYLNGH